MKIKKYFIPIILLLFFFIELLINLQPFSLKTSDIKDFSATISKTNSSDTSFSIYSDGAILIDSSTGKILYGKNENKKLYPASTTKILTAILAIENCNLEEKITASKTAIMSIPSGYSNAAIQPNESLTVYELLELFLIHSANEVGYIFAEHISGNIDDFAILMNKKANELGCKNTNFTNPSGLHNEDHYSSAYDMALIAKYCMKNDTFREIVSKTSCTIDATDKYEKRFFKNTNDLIIPSSEYYYEYAIGIKTGFTSQAKNCLISASKKDNLELIAVTLGANYTTNGKSGRYVDTLNLFEYGFSNYKYQQIATENTVIQDIVIDNTTKDTKNLSLVLKDSIFSIVPSDIDLSNLDFTVDLNPNISAPISKGDILGKITYNIDGISYSSDLIASHFVEEYNLKLLLSQIALAFVFLFILSKLFFRKKTKKRRKYS